MDNMERTVQVCKAIAHGWKELDDRMALLSAELQQLDRVRSDILHHIENTRFRKSQVTLLPRSKHLLFHGCSHHPQ